ncbi:MAG: hypothetical protein C4540_04570 [Candidatus Omnitrophota bacterium]|jgi:16S rRNA C1402 (ribose-2'-O) methylase RsmI|nr:MAG: hypothetical protein C4540_04570 [Candidatus Omnitrophota bacterium]
MCDPVSLTITGVVLAAASGGMTAYGQYQAGQSQNKYYRYLADQNEREAEAIQKTAEEQTSIIQSEAAQRAKELKGDVSRVKGAQKAAMAAMGLTGVTAEDILNDTANRAKLDETNIRYNADIQSWAVNKEANERAIALRNQSTLYRFAGKAAKRTAEINMTTTLLGTASSVAGGFGGMGSSKGSTVVGGRGGQVIDTQQYGRTWSPYKLY